jgi:hypothetical protein
MQTTTTRNTSAILRGEQRSARFRYRHSVAAAAQELGIPVTWIWFWLCTRQLRSKTWLRKVWVGLENVQALFADTWAVRDAFYATGEFLTSQEAIRQVVERWPDEYHPYIKFQLPAKLVRRAKAEVVSLPVSNPVLREEEKSEKAA